uniref:Putative secreted protein n=1 Tax=Anopheles marajoara TaxID=58244 RepID=A0A2M4C8N9_9DIPT
MSACLLLLPLLPFVHHWGADFVNMSWGRKYRIFVQSTAFTSHLLLCGLATYLQFNRHLLTLVLGYVLSLINGSSCCRVFNKNKDVDPPFIQENTSWGCVFL